VQTKDQELKDAQLAYDDNLKKLRDKAEEDNKKALQELQTLRDKVDKQATDLEKANLATEQAKKTLGKQVNDQKKELTKAKERIADQQSKIEATEVKSTEAPPDMRTDWKIVAMDQRGTHPYINLGSSDNVKSQQTFTIHGIGMDSRPIRQAKGTLEVVNVI